MCTLLMLETPTGLLLASNRDELWSRSKAHPPAIHTLPGGMLALYPQDADAGGTWVGANQAGCVVSLLNSYQEDDPHTTPPKPYTSRGLLVRSLLACPEPEQMSRRLLDASKSGDLALVRPFVLAFGQVPAAWPQPVAYRASWNGRALSVHPHTLPLFFASSGVDPFTVAQARANALAPLTQPPPPTPQALTDLFSRHDPDRPAHSLSMVTQVAHTVSHTRVELTQTHVVMTYIDGPPHRQDSPSSRVVMARKA